MNPAIFFSTRSKAMDRDNDTELFIWWSVAYLVNLPVAFVFGMMLMEKGGRIGMLFAMFLIWIVGCLVVARQGRFRQALLVGAFIVAFTEVFPILQIVAGSMACAAWGSMSGTNIEDKQMADNPMLAELGGFVITLLTAQPLIVLAIIIGGIFCWLFDWRHQHDEEGKDRDDENGGD